MTEKEIILKIRRGEINLFEVLVKKYSKKMYFYIYQKVRREDDRADILQNSFIKAYKALDTFDVNREFYPYFFSIIKREIAEFFRKNPNLIYLNEYHENLTSEEETEEIDFSNLQEKHKNVLQLLSEGYSYLEISEKLGKPINTIKTLIRRARLQILKNTDEKKS